MDITTYYWYLFAIIAKAEYRKDLWPYTSTSIFHIIQKIPDPSATYKHARRSAKVMWRKQVETYT